MLLRRIFAWLFDTLLLQFFAFFLGLFLGGWLRELGPYGQFCLIPVVVLYRGLLQRFGGATLGQRLMGLRVVSLEGGRLSWGQAIVRAVPVALAQMSQASMPFFGEALQIVGRGLSVSLPYLLWAGGGRSLHDRLAGTRVERRKLAEMVVDRSPIPSARLAPLGAFWVGLVAVTLLMKNPLPTTVTSWLERQKTEEYWSISAELQPTELQGQQAKLLVVKGWLKGAGTNNQLSGAVDRLVASAKAENLPVDKLQIEIVNGWDSGFSTGTMTIKQTINMHVTLTEPGSGNPLPGQ